MKFKFPFPLTLVIVILIVSLFAQPVVAQGIRINKGLRSPLLEMFPRSEPTAERTNVYDIQQTVGLSEIPPNTKQIRWWISIPRDSKNQALLWLNVDECPGSWKIVEDAERRGDFVYVEINDPQAEELDVTVSYRVRREPEFTEIDPSQVDALSDALRASLAVHLAKDAPHMEVTPEFKKIADKVCGQETNIALQAELLLRHVASTVDHYSYSVDPKMPQCGIGDASVCKKQGGGCCTDLNSYFITLARAREIPARLQMGFRVQEKNSGKLIDPGYRCWVEYFVPGYGWISADVVEADTPGGLGPKRWLSGLTSRRIWLNQGREFDFGLSHGKVNHMNIAYAEIDGVPARLIPDGNLNPQITRKVFCKENFPSENSLQSKADSKETGSQ
jgi:transglutaminase-like putative cysteine protease